MLSSITTVALLAASTCVYEAQAHVYLTQPLAEFKSGASKSSWVAEFPPPWTGSFKTGAEYAAAAPGKGFKDLRSFLESKGPACGNSLPNAKPKAIPSDGTIKLASTIEHAGPCEVWLDNTRAFYNEDCEKTFGSATSFKVNFSACKGSCMLRFYWLGLQASGRRWQAYKNCVPLGGGGGGGGAGNESGNDADNNKNSGEAPSPTPKAKTPKKKSEKRSADDDDEENTDTDVEGVNESESANEYADTNDDRINDSAFGGENADTNDDRANEYAYDDRNATLESAPMNEEFSFQDLDH